MHLFLTLDDLANEAKLCNYTCTILVNLSSQVSVFLQAFAPGAKPQRTKPRPLGGTCTPHLSLPQRGRSHGGPVGCPQHKVTIVWTK